MKIQKIAVIGHPIGHTMSPFIQKRLFALSGIPMEYSVIDVPELPKQLELLRQLDGFNVTVPHKIEMIPYLDWLDEKAKAFGSVNTVKVEKGKLLGYTTDGEGCSMALEQCREDFSGKILLLGNGGAARAIAFEIALQNPDFQIVLACRAQSLPKGEKLSSQVQAYSRSLPGRESSGGSGQVHSCSYRQIEEGNEEYDLLINATSVGMFPNIGQSPVSEAVISRCKAVFDAVYNPGETELLKISKRLSKKVIGGMDMLVYQAAAAHRIWYGTSFSKADMAALCEDARQELKRVFP